MANYHTLLTDEPLEAGGEDAGPDPYTLLLAALGSCISMTVTLYAKRKGWPLERVIVRLRQQNAFTRPIARNARTQRKDTCTGSSVR